MSEKLANCPFCGSVPKLFGSDSMKYSYAQCEGCRCETGVRESEAETIAAWNRRHQDKDNSSTFDRWVK
jgi:Lar family restriction alleviation protein